MKKSTLSIILGIAGIFVLITIANLKLSAEFKKGNIRSGMAVLQLPPFHHIKEIHPKDAENIWGKITLIQHKDSSALLYNYYGSPEVLYSVNGLERSANKFFVNEFLHWQANVRHQEHPYIHFLQLLLLVCKSCPHNRQLQIRLLYLF